MLYGKKLNRIHTGYIFLSEGSSRLIKNKQTKNQLVVFIGLKKEENNSGVKSEIIYTILFYLLSPSLRLTWRSQSLEERNEPITKNFPLPIPDFISRHSMTSKLHWIHRADWVDEEKLN